MLVLLSPSDIECQDKSKASSPAIEANDYDEDGEARPKDKNADRR